MVNVPTANRLPSHGELVASVELLIAHMTQFSTRLDRIESRVNDWVNLGLAERMTIAERGINALKTCHNENDTKIAATNIELDYAFDSIKYANERMVDSEKAIDRISDILTEHDSKLRHAKQRSRDNAKKCAEIGILRRRISKVEEFNTEFVECFDTPTQLRSIITQACGQAEECDRTLTYMVRYGCGGGCDSVDHSKQCDEYREEAVGGNDEDRIDAWKTVDDYFANYIEDDNGSLRGDDEKDEKDEKDEEDEEDDEFEKL
jgi:hypothetical protein